RMDMCPMLLSDVKGGSKVDTTHTHGDARARPPESARDLAWLRGERSCPDDATIHRNVERNRDRRADKKPLITLDRAGSFRQAAIMTPRNERRHRALAGARED